MNPFSFTKFLTVDHYYQQQSLLAAAAEHRIEVKLLVESLRCVFRRAVVLVLSSTVFLNTLRWQGQAAAAELQRHTSKNSTQ